MVFRITEENKGEWQGKWHLQFPNKKNPIHVELGTGKGQFLAKASTKFPDINWIGIEKIQEPLLKAVIRDAGGVGEFTTVTLGTSAYDALYSGNVDFTIPFLAWEGIEAEHNGTPMKYFEYADYGFPDAYSIVVMGNRSWLAEHPGVARAFVQTLQRGYQFAADRPDEAARMLIDANPGAFPDETLVTQSQQMLAARYLKDTSGVVGAFPRATAMFLSQPA